jgi:uncharacterized protein (TIGR03083 family)
MSPGDSADTIAAYTSACAFFGERLATVTDLDWERPTPCEGWDVRTLVAHVVTGEALVAQVLGGGGSWDADVDPTPQPVTLTSRVEALEADVAELKRGVAS